MRSTIMLALIASVVAVVSARDVAVFGSISDDTVYQILNQWEAAMLLDGEDLDDEYAPFISGIGNLNSTWDTWEDDMEIMFPLSHVSNKRSDEMVTCMDGSQIPTETGWQRNKFRIQSACASAVAFLHVGFVLYVDNFYCRFNKRCTAVVTLIATPIAVFTSAEIHHDVGVWIGDAETCPEHMAKVVDPNRAKATLTTTSYSKTTCNDAPTGYECRTIQAAPEKRKV